MARKIHFKVSARQVRALLLAVIIFSSVAAMPLTVGIDSGTVKASSGTSDSISSISTAAQSGSEGNGTVYIGSYDNNLYAIDAVTGDQKWSYTTGSWIYGSSPTVAGGTAYIGSYDTNVYAVDADTGAEQWVYSTGGEIDSSPTIVGGTVYIGSADTNLHAIDESTGNQEWNFSTGGEIRDSSPTVVGGTVYIGSQDNNLYAIDAETGEEQWNFTTGSGLHSSSPTVSGGTVYVGSNDDNLYAIDASTGEEEWNYTTGGNIGAATTIVDGTVYVGSNDNSLHAVDASTGQKQWNYSTGGDISSSATVSDGMVYFGSVDGSLYAVDESTGNEQWSYSTGEAIYDSVPTVANGTVHIGSSDSNLYALDAVSGVVEWSFSTGTSIESSPTFVSAGSEYSDGTRVDLQTLGHHERDGMETVSGEVTDQNGNAIGGATVTFENVETGSETVTQTDPDGSFGIGVESGRYDITISADGYQTLTVTEDVEPGDELGTFQLAPQQLDLQFTRYVEPGDSTPYTVEFTDENGTVVDVTGDVTMNSSNTSVATVDTGEVEIVGAEGVNGTSVITANYTVNNQTYTDTRRVTVATKTVDNLEILPGTWRFSAVLDDITIQVILVAIGAAIIATRAASSWAGLGAMELVILIGWFGGWVPLGIALLGLFTALFIGLNLAANIDYSVRR